MPHSFRLPADLLPLQRQFAHALTRDQRRLERDLMQLARNQNKLSASEWQQQRSKIQTALEQSIASCKQRRERPLHLAFDPILPFNERLDELGTAILQHQVVVVCGETGSGKTTQLPKLCLKLGRGSAGLIGHTQPRRIAARSIAARLNEELQAPLAGYKVRFNDRTDQNTAIKLMTDGILLAEISGDPTLSAYDTIILDEAHERSLNIDFLLGYLKRLLPRRPDLKLIITSATIDAQGFSQHFYGCPVLEVSGRTYPVEQRYRPMEAYVGHAKAEETQSAIEREFDLAQHVCAAVDELALLPRGDILVFLPGEREIRDVAEALRKHHPPGTEILPLFARLSVEEQQRVFRSGGPRRIVLATNVAETSLTVPGIRYVIDSGLARVKRYSARAKIEQLQIEPISQAAARQRAGRCGRVAAGVCIRLYSESDFLSRPAYTDPEIVRSSLAGVVLRMQAMKLGPIEHFPFLEAPSSRQINDGYQLLFELGAVDENRHLTELGRTLARLPLDPKVARMLVAAARESALKEVLIIAAGLSVQDPRERPFEAREAADRAHALWADERSDFMGYLKLWDHYQDQLEHKHSNRKLQQELKSQFLHPIRLREWRELHSQLLALCQEAGLRLNESPAPADAIHRALLTGLLSQVGMKEAESDLYLGARGSKFSVFPGSSLKKNRPKWLMAAELVDTHKLYARQVAPIQPEWLEQLAGHLIKRSYHDPQWDETRGSVIAHEKVTFFGLTLVARRRVQYARINPEVCRELFVRHALVLGEWKEQAPFIQHNRQLIQSVQALEHKARRQDVLIDEEALASFYLQHLGPDVVDVASFNVWRKQAEQQQPRLLFMSREFLMRHSAETVTPVLYPDHWLWSGPPEHKLRLKYRFEPGHVLDGVTVEIPLPLLNTLNPEPFEWLVPGLLREKITHLVKSLPKPIRRLCVPVPDSVTQIMQHLHPENGLALATALAQRVATVTQQPVQRSDFDWDSLPAHLRMNFRVVDDQKRELESGRNLAELQRNLGETALLTVQQESDHLEQNGLTRWSFGHLPDMVRLKRQGQTISAYPTLVDDGESVSLKVMDTEHAARQSMRAGVRRLMVLELKEQVKQMEKTLARIATQYLPLRDWIGTERLQSDLLLAIFDRAVLADEPLPRDELSFQNQKQKGRSRLPAVSQTLQQLLQQLSQDLHLIKPRLQGQSPLAKDVQAQVHGLIHPGFLLDTPWEQLQHLPRYIQAIRLRLDKVAANPSRDAQHMASIQALELQWQREWQRRQKASLDVQPFVAFRWALEELRVSLFAQELRTPYPVSVKRLQKMWGDLIQQHG